jgi:hypothetical protein
MRKQVTRTAVERNEGAGKGCLIKEVISVGRKVQRRNQIWKRLSEGEGYEKGTGIGIREPVRKRDAKKNKR